MALTERFSFVTVMDVKVYEADVLTTETYTYAQLVDDAFIQAVPMVTELASIDSLSISNITQEGPRKEARGGLYAQPKVRYGKTMRLEMEDVLLNKAALVALGAANVNVSESAITVDETFQTAKLLIGKTFVVDKATGNRVTSYIVFPRFLPDSIFNLSMESEGDAAVISLAGELFPDSDDRFYILDVTPDAIT